MTQIEMIPYIKDAIRDFETRNEDEYHLVMMHFSAVYSNYYLLLADKFVSQEEYDFFKEFLNRSHDFFYNCINAISEKELKYSQNNYFAIRIVLSSMLFGIERREKNLV